MKIVLIKVTKDTVIISLKIDKEINIENSETQHACTQAAGGRANFADNNSIENFQFGELSIMEII